MAIAMPTANPTPLRSVALPIKAASVCVMGEPGSGKTHSIITLLEAGLEVFIIVTDPNGLDTVLDQIRKHPRKDEFVKKIHWSICNATAPGWAALKEMGATVSRMGFEDIAKLKSGVGKQHTGVMMTLLETCQDFIDDRTGQHFGDVTTWDDTRALVIDSLSGINKIMMDHTVGYKPSAHQGEWGIAMKLEEQLIYTLAADCNCYFIVMAHLDKVQDGVTGMMHVTLAALGNKLAPQLIKLFSEVVLARREGDKFYWSTAEMNTAVKNRALGIGNKLLPNFAPVIAAHEARKAAMSGDYSVTNM